MIKIFHVSEDNFKAVITLPRFMQSDHGKALEIPFKVTECRRRRQSSLLYALEQQKPITVQVFRREHKSDQWYIHLNTYVQEVPITTSFAHGCLGVDLNKDSVEWAYILADGNIKEKGKLSFCCQGFSSGQRQVMMRNLVVKLTDNDEMGSHLSLVSSQSNRKIGKSPSPVPKYDQLCLGFE